MPATEHLGLLPRRAYVNGKEITVWEIPPPRFLNKEDRICCRAHRDDLGRYPIGFCGDDCLGRQQRDRLP